MNSRFATGTARSRPGFTLVELLTVIAIVGILSSLLFVTFGGVTAGAKRAKTRVQFAQWATAMEAFRQEYGFYPELADAVIDDKPKTEEFVEALSGRKIENGESLENTDLGWIAGNTKSVRFCSFGQDDLNDDRLVDAFGNDAIAVLVDRNQDGAIRIGSGSTDGYPSFPAVKGLNPILPEGGVTIRAGVIFYSPGAGKTTEDIVKSW